MQYHTNMEGTSGDCPVQACCSSHSKLDQAAHLLPVFTVSKGADPTTSLRSLFQYLRILRVFFFLSSISSTSHHAHSSCLTRDKRQASVHLNQNLK